MDQLYAERLIIIIDLQHRQISPTIAPVFKIHLALTNIFDLSSFLDFSWQESTNQNHSFGNTFFTAVVCSMTFTFTPCHDIVPVDMYHQTYFFHHITTFIKVCVAFVFRLQTLSMIDFTRIFQLKGLKSKNKGCTNFYESWDLTKTYIQPVDMYHTTIE